MSTAYESGAKYIVLFNYYTNDGNPYGTLKNEHFEALETFWNSAVKNSDVVHGSTKADSVLVLPDDYGWGMRWTEDKIWGIFKPDDKAQTIWESMESIFRDHGLQTDIVYEDPDFPLPPEYQHIYYWNQKY